MTDAEYLAELEAVLIRLAAINPMATIHGPECVICGADSPTVPHLENCPWVEATRLTAGRMWDGPGQ